VSAGLNRTEIAAIDELIKRSWMTDERWMTDEQREQERQRLLRHDEEVLQRLVRASPKTPWPKRVGPTSGRDGFLYVREKERLSEEQLALVVEVARRDGVVRYALAPGDPEIDIDQYWKRRDPSFKFILDRLNGVKSDDWDRAIDEAIDALLDSDIPLSRGTKLYLKEDRHERADSKRRQRNRDRARAVVINGQVDWLEQLLRDADFTDARTRAQDYLAHLWRKIEQQEGRARSRFSSGRALHTWVQWALER
jgi:hypothetical protein